MAKLSQIKTSLIMIYQQLAPSDEARINLSVLVESLEEAGKSQTDIIAEIVDKIQNGIFFDTWPSANSGRED